MQSPPIQRAFISVSDKTDLAFCPRARRLWSRNLQHGRHAPALARRRPCGSRRCRVHRLSRDDGRPAQDAAPQGLRRHSLPATTAPTTWRPCRPRHRARFELVVVNLYPFEATVARTAFRSGSDRADRHRRAVAGSGGAKNHAFVTIATEPEQYPAMILNRFTASGGTTLDLRRRWPAQRSPHGAYDRAIADYFARERRPRLFPRTHALRLRREAVLRYGENPHQQAALYRDADGRAANARGGPASSTARSCRTTTCSTSTARWPSCARSLNPAAAVIKHNNPCGAAVGANLGRSRPQGLDGDPLSAFGSRARLQSAGRAPRPSCWPSRDGSSRRSSRRTFDADALES